ncbi:MAG: 30S ribosomal protein S5 [Candidatus Bipolaricaulia bacterium]
MNRSSHQAVLNEPATAELQSEVIDIRRVAKVTKGGKNLSFRATVIVGDGAGRVGVGKGNTREIPQAVQQGIRDAQRNMISIPLVEGRTIPHEVEGKFKAARVLLKPAYKGTGIIAGTTVGTICRLAGIKDILTKSLGSTNPLTLARATLVALQQLRTPEEVARLRDKKVEELLR